MFRNAALQPQQGQGGSISLSRPDSIRFVQHGNAIHGFFLKKPISMVFTRIRKFVGRIIRDAIVWVGAGFTYGLIRGNN